MTMPQLPKLPPQYTWAQTWKFFLLGLVRACYASLLPVGYDIWDWVQNWGETPVEWGHMVKLALACAAVPAGLYWKNHWHQLKLPPALDVPDEFLMTQQTVTHTEQTVTTSVSKPEAPNG